MTLEIAPLSSLTTNQKTLEHVQNFYEYTQKSKSESSRKTYAFGWGKFTAWLKEHGYDLDSQSIPMLVGMFITDMAKGRNLKATSINTYLAAIKHYVWELKKIELDHAEIKRAMKGIRNDMKDIRKNKKGAILVEDLHKILEPMQGSKSPIDIRDRALLLIGFCGALRRSELAGIHLEHIKFDREGMTVLLPHSKTDQEGEGQYVQIPFGKHQDTCAVASLKAWLAASGIKQGAIFKGINRHGQIQQDRMTDKAVALIVKKRAGGLFDEGNIAGHSLRRGLVTSALEAGVADTVVMKQTRHTSVNMLKEYYQDLKDYQNNALRSLNL